MYMYMWGIFISISAKFVFLFCFVWQGCFPHTAPCRTCGGGNPKLTNHGTSGYSLPIKLSNCTPAPIFLGPSQDSWWISSAGKAS